MTYRRLLPLAPLTPALAVIAFAAAGAGAEGLADFRKSGNAVSDVQVGERGALMRVAIVCTEECRVGARSSGVFFLPGVAEDLEVDLNGRAENARALSFKAEQGGSSLAIRSDRPIVTASIKRCAIDGAAASCIDIEFAKETHAAAAPSAAGAPSTQEVASMGAVAAAGPALREAPEGEKLIFASLAPPERFAPPATPPAMKPAPAPLDDGPRLILDRRKAEALINSCVDIAAEARQILGRPFGPEECARADAKLKGDAWALDAMVDIGFCEAIRGDLDAASGVFERLLAYTPDNYEALVGRALIAARRGARSDAESLFQAALNALPPIAESDRIVAAMERL